MRCNSLERVFSFAVGMCYERGDQVVYRGPVAHIKRDYGNRTLVVVAVDPRSQSVVCKTPCGLLLVGIPPTDLELLS